MSYSTDSFDYPLPEERIARYPLPDRDGSRLLVWRNGRIEDREFRDLPDLLPSDAILFRNSSQVIPARLSLQTTGGARIEVFCLEPADSTRPPALELARNGSTRWTALIGNAKRWPVGNSLVIERDGLRLNATLEKREQAVGTVAFHWHPEGLTFADILEKTGAPPIPPYLKREAESLDRSRYQTHYAAEAGSVAAPTAGLHFTPALDGRLISKGISTAELTLHVGAGTFRPVETDDVRDHEMHAELFAVDRHLLEKLLEANGPRVAVGTTSMRALESLYPLAFSMDSWGMNEARVPEIGQWDAKNLPPPTPEYAKAALQKLIDYLELTKQDRLWARTRIMIARGHYFAFTDALITNFHQPRSTLLALVDAWIGEEWRGIYEHALAKNYRFLSYGDSSLLWGRN